MRASRRPEPLAVRRRPLRVRSGLKPHPATPQTRVSVWTAARRTPQNPPVRATRVFRSRPAEIPSPTPSSRPGPRRRRRAPAIATSRARCARAAGPARAAASADACAAGGAAKPAATGAPPQGAPSQAHARGGQSACRGPAPGQRRTEARRPRRRGLRGRQRCPRRAGAGERAIADRTRRDRCCWRTAGRRRGETGCQALNTSLAETPAFREGRHVNPASTVLSSIEPHRHAQE